MKNKQKNLNNSIKSGFDRIREIKSQLSSFKTAVCKADVYETWDNLFSKPEEE